MKPNVRVPRNLDSNIRKPDEAEKKQNLNRS